VPVVATGFQEPDSTRLFGSTLTPLHTGEVPDIVNFPTSAWPSRLTALEETE
jgi:hypothetical protein